MLATYSYADFLGNLSGMTFGNGASETPGDDQDSRITSIAQAFTNTANNVTWTFAYNPANQITTRTSTNDAYTSHPSAQSYTYLTNGLSQYSGVSGTSYSYDTRGNLTSDGTRAFTYDVDNHMLIGSAPTPLTVGFDPLGRRLYSYASGGSTVYFVYDGQEIAEEYASPNVLRRYVPSGLGETPLIWYEGTDESSPRWLHVDNQDSVMAYSDASGIEQAAYGYDAYGTPSNAGGAGHYSFTGQTTYGAVDAYNFKARTYDGTLGRFLEADPSGQAGGVNIYAYAGDDPVNGSDPTGTQLAPDWKLEEPGGFAELGDGAGSGGGGSVRFCTGFRSDQGFGFTLGLDCTWEDLGGDLGDLGGGGANQIAGQVRHGTPQCRPTII